MPYYLHSSICGPETGYTFESAKLAHEAKQDRTAAIGKMIVTFVPTEGDKQEWRSREFRRTHNVYGRLVDDVGYCPVPWYAEDWQIELDKLHYAYLSVVKPGLVAYTPSEEWGCQDRQLRVRPGKYLEQFASHLTQVQRDAYCAQIKAIDDSHVIRWAITADEIEHVYQHYKDSGSVGSSCMRYAANKFASDGVHPVAAYGDSDLALAYLSDSDLCTARAIVWPAKKYYYRVYTTGSDILSVLLHHEGYTQHRLDGARVRAIPCDGDDVYVMPYIDGCGVADLSRDRKWFTLGSGSYSTDNTNGVTDSDYSSETETYTCAHCGENDVYDEGDYCQSCLDEQQVCQHCDNEFLDDSPEEIDDYGIVCRSCYRRLRLTCDECRSTFFRQSFTDVDWRQRERNGLEDYCADCEDTILERRAEENADGDTKIVATDDTETLPLPLTAETETVF